MRFLVDAQLPPALARWFVGKGHEAEHVADCGLADASDRAIWGYALDVGAVILTKDEDFSVRKTLEPAGPVVVPQDGNLLCSASPAHCLRYSVRSFRDVVAVRSVIE